MHGTRRTYRAGCRCCPCRAANAAAERRRDHAHRAGRPLLGSLVSAVEANRKIRQMKVEGFTNAALARALGLKHPILQLHTGPDAKATRRTVLRIHRLWRERMTGEGPDAPLNEASPS